MIMLSSTDMINIKNVGVVANTQDSKILLYPLVLLLPGDVHHLLYEVAKAVLQNLHVVFGLFSVGISRVLSHLNVQM